MKKATIKRRKRVIPAAQEDEDMEDADSPEAQLMERTPERGTENDDGSINLGVRRRPEQQHSLNTLPRDAVMQANRQNPLRPSTSDLAAYQRKSPYSQNVGHGSEETRLPPMSSMSTVSERQSSMSPASFLSPQRKRSFSATDTEGGSHTDNGPESAKRISSIKSILNPTMGGDERTHTDDMNNYTLPPLRSGAATMSGSHGKNSFGAMGGNDAPGQMTGEKSEIDRVKAERRLQLQKEAERMRELLAAKELELMELGNP